MEQHCYSLSCSKEECLVELYEVDFMRTLIPVSPPDLTLAPEFARRLAEQISPHLFQVTLFGSRARGDANGKSNPALFIV